MTKIMVVIMGLKILARGDHIDKSKRVTFLNSFFLVTLAKTVSLYNADSNKL